MKEHLNENIDIHSLKAFCKVVVEKSFTKAAKALFLSQPTISAHISKLEECFGAKLLDRLGNEILPTRAGLILFEYGCEILKMKDEMVQSVYGYLGNISGKLLLGASTIAGSYMLPEYVVKFKNMHPKVKVIVEIGDSLKVMEWVDSGRIELGFVGAQPDKLSYEHFDADNLVLIVHPEHRWTKIKDNVKKTRKDRSKLDIQIRIDMNDLKDEPFIMREKGSGTRKATEKGLERSGFNLKDLNIVCELGSTEAVKQAVMEGIGVSIISDRAVKNEIKLGLMKIVKVKGVNIKRDFYLIYDPKRTMPPVAQSFIQFLSSKGAGSRYQIES